MAFTVRRNLSTRNSVQSTWPPRGHITHHAPSCASRRWCGSTCQACTRSSPEGHTGEAAHWPARGRGYALMSRASSLKTSPNFEPRKVDVRAEAFGASNIALGRGVADDEVRDASEVCNDRGVEFEPRRGRARARWCKARRGRACGSWARSSSILVYALGGRRGYGANVMLAPAAATTRLTPRTRGHRRLGRAT